MSVSPKPSAPAGIPGTAVEVEFPRGMFFNALDYAPDASAKAERTATQVKVSGARNQALGNLTRVKDRLGNSLAHLRSADDYGLVTSSMDVLVGLADEFHDAVLKLARLADNAEARYEDHFQAGPAAAAPETQQDPDVCLICTAPDGAEQVVRVPSGLQARSSAVRPSSLAALVRRMP